MCWESSRQAMEHGGSRWRCTEGVADAEEATGASWCLLEVWKRAEGFRNGQGTRVGGGMMGWSDFLQPERIGAACLNLQGGVVAANTENQGCRIKFHKVMDWDLWGPPCNQDAREVNSMDHGWNYPDEIEEDALNEKSCIQVLRILISKADNEIEELEGDLGVLQSQLQWAEQNKYKEWSEICCNGLREKIDLLEISIQNKRNESGQNEHDNAVDSLTHTEPVKKVHDVVKALLRNYHEDKDEQPADIIVKDIQSDALKPAMGHSNENQSVSNFDSKDVGNEEAKEPSVTCIDKSVNFSSSKKPKGKRTDLLETIKAADDIVNAFRSDASRAATGYYDEKQNLGNFDARPNGREEVKEPSVTPTDKSIILYSTLKMEGKRTNLPGTVKVQEAGFAAITNNTVLNSQLKLQDSGAKDTIKPEPVEFQEPIISADDNTVSLNLSSKLPRQIEKTKIQSNPGDAQEPVVPPTDITSNSSSHTNGKREEKSGFIHTNTSICFNQHSSEKKAKRKVQLVPSDAQKPNVAPNISLNSLLKSQDKRRKGTIAKLVTEVKETNAVQIACSTLHGVTTESTTEEDLQLSNSCNIDNSNNELMGPPRTPNHDNLKALTLIQLKAIAKEHNMKGFAKMLKSQLIEFLIENLSSC
ncbi:hypothetical protein HHK36_019751 [Tetracentron sinense]|uniref:Rho termination factor-like N-terminal domain-containing protein n=1 Tax=Tetracentron sinense TaxID=13715 RepID=A0A834Z2R3_TETSI|nr:hypothetical protein HHK36_019751 [Tetracentron sinense]